VVGDLDLWAPVKTCHHASKGKNMFMSLKGYITVDQIQEEINVARRTLGVNPQSPLPIGVGFLCWRLEIDAAQGKREIKTALDNHVVAVWLSFGRNLSKWIQFVRDHDKVTGTQTIIFVQVSSVDDALVAIHDWKVDVIVAQGFISSFQILILASYPYSRD